MKNPIYCLLFVYEIYFCHKPASHWSISREKSQYSACLRPAAFSVMALARIANCCRSTCDASESHGVNGRVPVLPVRSRAPVLPSAPPLALSTRIREPAHDMHLHSLATDCRAYRCPLADERCPGPCSSRMRIARCRPVRTAAIRWR